MRRAPNSRVGRALLTGATLLAALTLAGCALPSGGMSGASSPTATPATAPAMTRCAQVSGFTGAQPLDLPHVRFPAGTITQPPRVQAGGASDYTVTTYLACAPHTDTNLTVQTPKGPMPFLTLAGEYGWSTWGYFPLAGSAQASCPGACLAFNAEDPVRFPGLFMAAPGFLSLSAVAVVGQGVVTFTLRVTTPPPAPGCASLAAAAGGAQYAVWYDHPAGIQFPPDTISSPDATMSTNGSVQCSPGTVASVKAFMDRQFQAAGYTSDPCQAYDCWKKNGVVVSLQLSSAMQWYIFTPRILPTTQP